MGRENNLKNVAYIANCQNDINKCYLIFLYSECLYSFNPDGHLLNYFLLLKLTTCPYVPYTSAQNPFLLLT